MWYQEAKRQNRILFTAPYADASTGEIMVSVAAPLKVNGEFRGAIFTDVSLKGLADISNSVNLFGAGYAFIVGNDNNFIAHPKAAYNGKPMSQVFSSDVTLTEGMSHTEIDDNKHLMIFSPLQGLDWYLGIALNEDIIFSAVSKLRRDAIMYSIVALLIAVLLLGAIIKQLMQPLKILNDAIDAKAAKTLI